jgi:hypothetical protein
MTDHFSKKLPQPRPKGQFGEGITVQGQMAQIASALFFYSWHPDVTINDCQYHLKNMVRLIHIRWIHEDMKKDVPVLVPMTDKARECIRKGDKVILEHMLPVHVITTTLFDQFWEHRPATMEEGIALVKETLEKTRHLAYVSKEEDNALKELQFRMADGHKDPFKYDDVLARYSVCKVQIPTISSNTNEDLDLLRKVRSKKNYLFEVEDNVD